MTDVSGLSRTPPRQIIAGDSIEFLIAVPAAYAGWGGSARLTGPDNFALGATTVEAINTDYRVFFAGRTDDNAPGTGALGAGHYQLSVWAANGSGATARRATLAQFPMSLQADLSKGNPAAAHCVKMLAIIERALECRLSGNKDGGLEQYTIDGTSVLKVQVEVLNKLRNKYAAEVAQLQNPNGSISRIPFTFGYAGQIPDMRRRFGQQ